MRRDFIVASWVFVALLGMTSSAHGEILFEDIFFWMPDGSTIIDPEDPPLNAFVKIQETVFDDASGRAAIQEQIDLGIIHGGLLPVFPINLYAYAITNLNYGNGPIVGGGSGITGFNIPDIFGVGGVQWGPNAANNWWEVAPGHSGPGNFEWDIDADNDSDSGDGNGILSAQTFNSFYVAVPAGTPHGFIDGAWVHSWSGGGLLEQSTGSGQIDSVFGILSGPVPEPSSLVIASLGLLGLAFCGWGRKQR